MFIKLSMISVREFNLILIHLTNNHIKNDDIDLIFTVYKTRIKLEYLI